MADLAKDSRVQVLRSEEETLERGGVRNEVLVYEEKRVEQEDGCGNICRQFGDANRS